MDEIGAFCPSKVVAEKKKPRIEEDARLSFGDCKTPFFLETSLETERECALAVAVGQHLFADFAESGHILREGVLNTATIVGAEANGVVALHIK